MPTNSAPLTGGIHGLAAELSRQPVDALISSAQRRGQSTGDDDDAPAGLRDVSEEEAFKRIHALVEGEEDLARSRMAIDLHWSAIRQGYEFSELRKVTDRNMYEQSFPPGAMRRNATPNKAADLCNKMVETLLVDRALPDPEAEVNTEQGRLAARMAKEFLRQDGGEAGTDDTAMFYALVDGATTKSSTFGHLWVDPVGGGFIPKQIKAHPKAEDPSKPLDYINPATGLPEPTTDYVLRYVTEDGQFTDSPIDAAVMWLPRIKVNRLDRRHVRLFPNDVPLGEANRAVVIFYATVSEGRRRWPKTVGEMSDGDLRKLCAWRPPRAEKLVPAALRSRLNTRHEKGPVADEQIFFYYAFYEKCCPDYPEGIALIVNGADRGMVLDDEDLSAVVERPSETEQSKMVEERKPMDLPLFDVMLALDINEGDPTGGPLIERVGGANEAQARLVTGFLEYMERMLSRASFLPVTSSLSARDIEESRRTGKPAAVTSKDDYPTHEPIPPMPDGVLNVASWIEEHMDKAFGLSQAAQGDDKSPEVSGVARRIAVNQSLVAVGGAQSRVHRAWERYWRLKLQFCQKYYKQPQMLRFVGPDGAAKQEWFTGKTFALVGGVRIQKGTGTLLPPTEKVNFAKQLEDIGYLDKDEAADIARPAFASQLGDLDNAHQERIERQVTGWLQGPPEGWEEQMQQYMADLAAYEQAMQAQQEAAMLQQAQGEQQMMTQQADADRQAQERQLQQKMMADSASEQGRLGLEREKMAATMSLEQQKLAASQQAEQEKMRAAVMMEEMKQQFALAMKERDIAAQVPPAPPPKPTTVTTIERLPDGGFRAITKPVDDPNAPGKITTFAKTGNGYQAVSTPTE